jgi:amino acid transporter
VFCFAEASSLFIGTGGPYLYAREAFGNPLGFAGGWMMWSARVTAFAANSNLFISFLGYFVPQWRSGIPRTILLTGLVAVLAWINVRGVRQGALVGDFLALSKLLPLLAFVGVGLFFIQPHLFDWTARPSSSSFGQAILLYVYAFTGFEYAAIPAGEALAPRKHLPMVMISVLILAGLLYTGIQVVCVGTMPDLVHSQTAVADASARFLGSTGGQIIALAALVSISGNLSGMALISPRLTYALAEDRLLPRALGAVHAKYRTPYVSILLYSVLTLALALSGTFAGMVKMSAVARIIPYLLTCLAVPALRRKYPNIQERFRLKGGMTIPALAALLCIWLLVQSQWTDLLATAAALAVGFLLYGISRHWKSTL